MSDGSAEVQEGQSQRQAYIITDNVTGASNEEKRTAMFAWLSKAEAGKDGKGSLLFPSFFSSPFSVKDE